MTTETFLFTDIEGSTRLWEEFGDAMGSALTKHDELLETAISEAGGHVFKHTGDGLLAIFPSPTAAVRAAARAQQLLAAGDFGPVGAIRVRMAIHAGAVEERDGDFFGPTLNRAARIMDAAHGGQVLLSAHAAAIIATTVPEGLGLRDLGEHRLKDLGEPERLHQLTGPGLAEEFGSVQSLEATPNNLPVQLTSFVGRDHELTEVLDLLADNRVVTVTGVGGVGKTRLALQVAAESIGAFPEGVWFVELAPISDSGLVLPAVAAAAHIAEEPSKSLIETVANALGAGPTLLLIDNCEHVIDEVAKVVDELLRLCPDLWVLATSREGLAVGGERLWRCPSMSASGDAIALFLERAELVGGVDAGDASTRRAIERICERLDGIPLAIELATARLKVFTAEQLAGRLDDRFRILTGGSRTAVPRQRTLQAAMDWSHDLLPDHERVLLRRLGVFHGGFTLEEVEAVCADDAVPAWEVLDLLTHLVDASLVTFDRTSAYPRYRLLETVRQYSMDRLAEAGEADAFRRRHAVELATMVAGVERGLLGPDADAWAARCQAEADNVRAALTWAMEADEPELALELAAGFSRYWSYAGLVAEGREWLSQALRHEHPDSLAHAEAAGWLAHFLQLEQKIAEARPLSERGLEIAKRSGDAHTILRLMTTTANILADENAAAALEIYREIAERARELGEDYLQIALFNVATHATRVGRYEESEAAANELLATAAASGQSVAIVMAQSVAATAAFRRGALDEARKHAAAAKEAGRGGFAPGDAWSDLTLANIALVEGDLEAARAHASTGRISAEQTGELDMLDMFDFVLAEADVFGGRSAQALELFDEILARMETRSSPEIISIALGVASAAVALGDGPGAVRAAQYAKVERDRLQDLIPVPWQPIVAELESDARSLVDAEDIPALEAEGAKMSVSDLRGLVARLRRTA